MGVQTISCKCLKTCKDFNEEVDLAKGDYLRTKTGNIKINNDPKNLTPLQQIKKSPYNSRSLKTENVSNPNCTNNNNEIRIKETLNNPIIEETEENKYLETKNLKTVNTMGNDEKNENNNNKNEDDKKKEKDNSDSCSNNSGSNNSCKSNKSSKKSKSSKINKMSKKSEQKEDSKKKENKDNIKNFEKNNSLDSNNKKSNINKSTSKPDSCSSIKYVKNIDKNIFFTDKLKKAEKNFDRPINYEKDWAQYCDDTDNEDMLILINAMNSNKGENHTKEEGQVIEHKGEKFLYIGELDKNQKPIGFGVLYTTKGVKYEGNFNKGKLIGLGRYIDENGICYEGIFENNKLVSKAKIINFNENNKKVNYFGETNEFKKNGKGEENCDEYRYVGEFEGDLRHGHGRIEFLDNGDLYEGDFSKGEITGKGLYIWNNNQQYKGDFVKGIKHGKGKYKWPDGFEYEGEYNNGIREGLGTYKWKDGRVFKGRFRDGRPDGKGKLTYNGKTINIEYKNGKPTEDIKKLFQIASKEK